MSPELLTEEQTKKTNEILEIQTNQPKEKMNVKKKMSLINRDLIKKNLIQRIAMNDFCKATDKLLKQGKYRASKGTIEEIESCNKACEKWFEDYYAHPKLLIRIINKIL